jgi:hypothetical protein
MIENLDCPRTRRRKLVHGVTEVRRGVQQLWQAPSVSDKPLEAGVVCRGGRLAAENPLKTETVFQEDMLLTEVGKDTRFREQALTPFTVGPLRHRAQAGKPVEFG